MKKIIIAAMITLGMFSCKKNNNNNVCTDVIKNVKINVITSLETSYIVVLQNTRPIGSSLSIKFDSVLKNNSTMNYVGVDTFMNVDINSCNYFDITVTPNNDTLNGFVYEAFPISKYVTDSAGWLIININCYHK